MATLFIFFSFFANHLVLGSCAGWLTVDGFTNVMQYNKRPYSHVVCTLLQGFLCFPSPSHPVPLTLVLSSSLWSLSIFFRILSSHRSFFLPIFLHTWKQTTKFGHRMRKMLLPLFTLFWYRATSPPPEKKPPTPQSSSSWSYWKHRIQKKPLSLQWLERLLSSKVWNISIHVFPFNGVRIGLFQEKHETLVIR